MFIVPTLFTFCSKCISGLNIKSYFPGTVYQLTRFHKTNLDRNKHRNMDPSRSDQNKTISEQIVPNSPKTHDTWDSGEFHISDSPREGRGPRAGRHFSCGPCRRSSRCWPSSAGCRTQPRPSATGRRGRQVAKGGEPTDPSLDPVLAKLSACRVPQQTARHRFSRHKTFLS